MAYIFEVRPNRAHIYFELLDGDGTKSTTLDRSVVVGIKPLERSGPITRELSCALLQGHAKHNPERDLSHVLRDVRVIGCFGTCTAGFDTASKMQWVGGKVLRSHANAEHL